MNASDLDQRLDLRSQTRRRNLWRRGLLAVGGLVALIVLGWLVWFSPLLRVQSVAVTGNQLTSTDEVLQAAQVPIDVPLARLDGAAIRARVQGLPAVAGVELHRNWPDRLVIEVTERQLVYQRFVDGRYQWVDAEGRLFYHSAERVPGVVAITASDDRRLLRDVATMILALDPDLAVQVDRVEATSIDHLVIYLVDGRQIVWGNAEQSAEKAALLLTLLKMTGTVIDVSVPGRPAIR